MASVPQKKTFKVFRRKRSKVCEPVEIPLGGDFKPGPDYDSTPKLGPDTYEKCSEWINKNCDEGMEC